MPITNCQMNQMDTIGRAMKKYLDMLDETGEDAPEQWVLEEIFHCMQHLMKEFMDERERHNRKQDRYRHRRKAAERGDDYKLN